MFPVELIVDSLKVVYTQSCPLLTINTPFVKKERPLELAEYIVQFWSSRNKNKKTAQYLVTSGELLTQIKKIHPEVLVEEISSAISTLIAVKAFWEIDVDTRGSNVKKLLIAPLGLALWWSIDAGTLFNQKEVSYQYIQQLLDKNILLNVLQAENEAWLTLNQERLAAAKGAIDARAVCLGMFLLLNGAIAREHALHLVRTSNKDYQWHDTITKGLNIVAQILYDKELFTVPSLKDDLQRRSELLKKVGSSFNWPKPRKGESDEFYWWGIGEYSRDPSILHYVVQSLVRAISLNEDGVLVKNRLLKLVNYFMHKVDYRLDGFHMSDLFPHPPARDFNYELQDSIDKALYKVTMKQSEPHQND